MNPSHSNDGVSSSTHLHIYYMKPMIFVVAAVHFTFVAFFHSPTMQFSIILFMQPNAIIVSIQFTIEPYTLDLQFDAFTRHFQMPLEMANIIHGNALAQSVYTIYTESIPNHCTLNQTFTRFLGEWRLVICAHAVNVCTKSANNVKFTNLGIYFG